MAERKSFPLRISPDLWEDLQRMANEEFRSVNAQIEFLLREAVKQRRKKIEEKNGD
ncbi:MAG: Arc family DNA binding domain-containing protein [Armatimonadetes bacterium 55-13]|nr:toxin-antitoxin system HicB family antitoxin [Armatimonadota bacterium]OJU63643.1 MAG: Arc family DNA binding domain-containing protein [Armatimonadetes bacterium 55-13]